MASTGARRRQIGGGMTISRWLSSAAVLVGCIMGAGTMVKAQGSADDGWDPLYETCQLAHARGTVIGDKMFVDGGEMTDVLYWTANQLTPDDPLLDSNLRRWQNLHLWELDLSKKFNTSSPPWRTHSKPAGENEHYNGATGSLWNFGDGKFHTWGGWFSIVYHGPNAQRFGPPYFFDSDYMQLPRPRVFHYDPSAKNWTSTEQPEDIKRRSGISYTQSIRQRLGFSLGGMGVLEYKKLAKGEIPGPADDVMRAKLATYSMRNKTWTDDQVPDEMGPTVEGVLVNLERVGNEGVLRPMSEIWLYDIETKTWFKQTATGDIPAGRNRMCYAVVPAPDNTSWQIYIFSGLVQERMVLEMSVLTVPAFVWKKIEIKGYPDSWGISDMACGLYEDRQLIVVPGERNVSTAANSSMQFFHACNIGMGVRVFDTHDWEFKEEFDPDRKGATVPDGIVDLIGGGNQGNSEIKEPVEVGWNDNQLGSIFSIRNKAKTPEEIAAEDAADRSSTTTISTASATATTSNTSTPSGDAGAQDSGDSEDSKSNTGAIAGGVVGGIAALAIVGLFFFLRHRKNKEEPGEIHGYDDGPHPRVPEMMDTPHMQTSAYYDSAYGGPVHAPQELHGFEPQEMVGSAGYYVPVKYDTTQEERGVLLPEEFLPPPPTSPTPMTGFIQRKPAVH
ncbi:hypothetical protein BDZ91DRAFT_729867 [Kalaharituber pfeilii]|nr:hypothetical protein BDZ91DRAFT_729867 [Kalaharituber pfeilii]